VAGPRNGPSWFSTIAITDWPVTACFESRCGFNSRRLHQIRACEKSQALFFGTSLQIVQRPKIVILIPHPIFVSDTFTCRIHLILPTAPNGKQNGSPFEEIPGEE